MVGGVVGNRDRFGEAEDPDQQDEEAGMFAKFPAFGQFLRGPEVEGFETCEDVAVIEPAGFLHFGEGPEGAGRVQGGKGGGCEGFEFSWFRMEGRGKEPEAIVFRAEAAGALGDAAFTQEQGLPAGGEGPDDGRPFLESGGTR